MRIWTRFSPVYFPLFISMALALRAFADPKVALNFDHSLPQARFAAREISNSLFQTGAAISTADPGWTIHLQTAPSTSPGAEQSYRMEVAGRNIRVTGDDANGLMYGGLELAEQIRIHKRLARLRSCSGKPHILNRGIKFNIPLDLRTPSYSDCSDAFQQNIPEMWSVEFWQDFLQEMARHRYNVLSLWSLHPFPSLVRVPEFPEIALTDVWRTRKPLDDDFSHSGNNMLRPFMLEDVEIVKRMTIEEKVRFWREVMEYANGLGIQVYWFTWNIFTFGAEPKYGINASPSNEVTKAYFRASVREMLLNYPLLAGMGITAGENMPRGDYSKERWLWETYGEGIRDGLKQRPGRSFRLIHRFHMTGQSEILREWADYPGPFEFSFKYSIAHMYSITNPPFIQPALEQMERGKKTWLTVRNDDIYSFRWGDPDYARNYILCMPDADRLAGFYMGPDGYCWGRSFLEKDAVGKPPLVIEKQWYSFLLWGRLSYDPRIPNSRFEQILESRFREIPAKKLYTAWANASQVMPLITRFNWGDIDLRWLPEACISSPRHKGFYTVRHFIESDSMPGSGVQNVRDWRRAQLSDTSDPQLVSPLSIADALEKSADQAWKSIEPYLTRKLKDPELRATLTDLEAFVGLGRYYAFKIRGACELAMFDVNRQESHRVRAIGFLESAAQAWKSYGEAYSKQYRHPVLYNRVGWVDIPELNRNVREDIDLARRWIPGQVPDKVVPPGQDTPFRK